MPINHVGCSQPGFDPEGFSTISGVVGGEGGPQPPFVDPNLGGRRVGRSANGLPRGGGRGVLLERRGRVGWLVGCTTWLWRPVPPPPPRGVLPKDLCRINGYGPPLPLPARSLPNLLPLSSPSPCRVPLVPAPAVSLPRTVPRTGPVAARHTLSQSPDMNLFVSHPASAGSAITWTPSDPSSHSFLHKSSTNRRTTGGQR